MDRTCKIKRSFDVTAVLWAAAITFLSLFILLPLICVFSKIRWSDLTGIFTAVRFRKTILNTFLECICSTGLSVLTGYIYAYAVVFGRMPFKKFFGALPVLHLITPPFVGGLAFILLLGRQGLITKTILGLDVSLYGFPGLLIAQVLCFFPLAYLMCKESFEALNKNLIEGAVSLGASRLKIFFRVIFPLTFPALVSSFLFIAVSVLSDFGNPMLVGGRFKVLAVEIYTQLTGWMNAGTSAALGLVLLVPSLLLFLLQNKMFKKQAVKTAVIGGKGGVNTGTTDEPVFRNSLTADILLFIFVLVIALAVLLQFVSIIFGSFQKLWGIDTAFTFDHLKKTFKYGKDFFNSVSFAFVASTLSVIIAAFVSYCVHRTGNRKLIGKNFIDSLIQFPAAIPGSLFGLALSITANTLHIKAPKFLILMAITVAFMPFSYRIVTSTFGQIKKTLDEGAMSLGAKALKVFAQVLVPLAAGGISSGWTYNFARGVGTLSSVIFLVSFNTPLCSVRILNLAEQGDWGRAAAMAMELTLITFGIIGAGKLIIKKRT
ncbi:MAG: iron ABC transporter permease [Treponema sp.]|nr:iron ABC transporter permease [Treponema sp.]